MCAVCGTSVRLTGGGNDPNNRSRDYKSTEDSFVQGQLQNTLFSTKLTCEHLSQYTVTLIAL